jgi:3-phosphoshikimate 1-carboxyvinyltransferase
VTAAAWQAPRATSPVAAVVTLPGSKSVTNRALVLGALAQEPTVIRRPLVSRDTRLMAAALRALGTGIDTGDDEWVITPGVLRGPATVDVGNAGTVMRFVPPLSVLAEGDVLFDGDSRARQRPLGPVVEALRDVGADIVATDGASLPLLVRGRGWLLGGDVSLDASLSSQFVSGLLLSAPRYVNGITVRHVGPAMPSLPHVAMTVAMLRDAGALVEDAEADVWRIEPGPLHPDVIIVEPDLSNAAPFLAAALVTGGRVTITDWPATTTQAGDALRGILTSMGGRCTLDDSGLTVRGGDRVVGIDADLHAVGELAPVIAAIAALATSASTLRGIGHLRNHETDRLAALAKEINALGGDVGETADGLLIRPRPLRGGVVATYDDHRIATAAALLGLVIDGVEVEDIATTGKTMPEFTALWTGMLAS